MTTKTKRTCDCCSGTKSCRTNRLTACTVCRKTCCDRCVHVRGRGKTRASLCTDCNRTR